VRRAALIALLLALGVTPALAVKPDEMLADPVLEARARAISADLRCLVCQNQSIDDSDADLARDLRLLVRERLTAGDTDEQALDYIVARYGDFVLLDPPFKAKTWALWLGPFAVLAGAAVSVGAYVRRQARRAEPASAPLSPEETRRLRDLLDEPRG
jgi:cytochrome c-type biogenesis protein CcmH